MVSAQEAVEAQIEIGKAYTRMGVLMMSSQPNKAELTEIKVMATKVAVEALAIAVYAEKAGAVK
jgi:hypothetical protein